MSGFHHPARGSSGSSASRACALPVSAWQRRMALSAAGARRPQVSYASVTGASTSPLSRVSESRVTAVAVCARGTLSGMAAASLKPLSVASTKLLISNSLPTPNKQNAPHPVRGEGHRDTTLFCRAWYRRAASVTAGTREHTERQGMLTVPTRLGLQRWLCATASVRGSEVIYGGGGGAEFSPATALYSHGPRAYSSSSLPLVPLVIVLTIVTCRPQNKPPSARGSRGRIAFGGMRAGAYLLISRTISPEFAPCPLHCGWVARLLRAVFPQPLLMRVGHHVFNC